MSKESDGVLLNNWCMAACYSTDEDGTVRLPFDIATGELIPEIWKRWLEMDPVRMVAGHADVLRSMRAIYIDAGKKDEWFLDLGAEAFRRELDGIGVTDVFFELFDATHMGIEYRYPLSLKYLAERALRMMALMAANQSRGTTVRAHRPWSHRPTRGGSTDSISVP